MKNKIINILAISIVIIAIATTVYGLYGIINRVDENNRIVAIQKEAEFNKIKELTLEEQSKLSKICIDGGLVPSLEKEYFGDGYNNRKSKVINVSCREPRQPTSAGEGIRDAAAIGGAVYIGSKLLGF